MATRRKTRTVQALLRDLGWPIAVDGSKGSRTNEAIRDFKRMYAWRRSEVPRPKAVLGTGFSKTPNAVMGAKFMRCLRFAVNRSGRCAPHFRFAEFKSKGNGWIKGDRYHIISLEILRNRTGKAIPLLSAYRDPHHNDVRVKGARNSQHKLGLAIDPSTNAVTLTEARAIKRFSGIGYKVINGRAIFRHGDCRHRGPWNFTAGSPSKPTEWRY